MRIASLTGEHSYRRRLVLGLVTLLTSLSLVVASETEAFADTRTAATNNQKSGLGCPEARGAIKVTFGDGSNRAALLNAVDHGHCIKDPARDPNRKSIDPKGNAFPNYSLHKVQKTINGSRDWYIEVAAV